jgi:hypothetical protein
MRLNIAMGLEGHLVVIDEHNNVADNVLSIQVRREQGAGFDSATIELCINPVYINPESSFTEDVIYNRSEPIVPIISEAEASLTTATRRRRRLKNARPANSRPTSDRQTK